MSTADVAVKVFRMLEPEDLRVLLAVDLAGDRYQYVPEKNVPRLTGLSWVEVSYRLSRLEKFNLIRRWKGHYTGYVLNMAGYDCLAINALVKAGFLEAFGKSLGVGKEADVYDALTPDGSRVAVKFHRLGRQSFRQTRRVRGYAVESPHGSWLRQSRLAAEKELKALKLVHSHGVSVPEPIGQDRHVIVMGMINGTELYHYSEIPGPKKVLDAILTNVRLSYLKAEVIHADLSEFNIILDPDFHILIIDWPQFVRKEHPNAEQLLRRDIKNITHFFRRRFKVDTRLEDALAYIKGTVHKIEGS